jgi:2-oxoglutarate dehydrogenase E1 component
VAVVRVEQLYPFPHKAFAAEMKRYPNATEIVWCQDEPQNQGAWFFVQHYDPREHARRARSWAMPGGRHRPRRRWATAHLHQEQQKALLDQAFGKLKGFMLTK